MAGILGKLAKALGKSEDEVLEALSKKGRVVTSGADEIDLGDATSPTLKKGRPAKSSVVDPNEIELDKPSKKKLELGDAASDEVSLNELDMPADKIDPNIDDMRLPTANPITERGVQGGGPVPSLKTETPEMGGPLAPRKPTFTAEAAEAGPEVIGKGTSRATKPAAEAMEAELVKKGMNPRLAKIAIASGLIGGGAMMMGGGDEPPAPPMAPKAAGGDKPLVMPDELNALAQQEALDQAGSGKSGISVPAQVLANFKGVPTGGDIKPEQAQPEEMDFVKMLEAAQRDAASERNMASLVRASELFGAGMARIKPDHGSSDIKRKEADKKVDDAKAKIAASKEQQAFNKAKDEMADETKMRDPNSEISKMVTSIAQKVGILKPGQSSSAMALKNAGVNLGTLLATIEAGNARRDAAALSRSLRADEKASTREFKAEEDRKKREDKRKLVTEEIEARKRTIEDNIKRARDIVKKYGTVEATGPESELLQGILDEIAVDMAKLQDPDSVARPAEVQLVRKSLIPEDTLGRMTMSNATADEIMKKFEERVQERAATGYKVRGIEEPTDRKSGGNNNSGEKTVVSKQYSPSRDKTKFVYSDGTEELKDGKQ